MNTTSLKTLVRHEGEAPRERSTCGWRDRLISREDSDVAAWAHAVDIDGARPHYHKRSTELYYVLHGEGVVLLDGVEHPVKPGSIVHIPPGVCVLARFGPFFSATGEFGGLDDRGNHAMGIHKAVRSSMQLVTSMLYGDPQRLTTENRY